VAAQDQTLVQTILKTNFWRKKLWVNAGMFTTRRNYWLPNLRMSSFVEEWSLDEIR
jgi:hypothetical protein